MVSDRSILGVPKLSLAGGGPLFRLEQRLELLSARHGVGLRVFSCLLAITWAPLLLLGSLDRVLSGTWPALITRSEVHLRMLAALGLFCLAEALFAQRVEELAEHLARADLLAPAARSRWAATVTRVLRWRDAYGPELALLSIVYGLTVLAYFARLPPWAMRWLAPTLHEAPPNLSRAALVWWWYVWISQPLFLFVMLRWLERWLFFVYSMNALAGMRPRLRPGHADRAGGLAFLASPLIGMQAFTLGAAFTLLSAWLDEILRLRLEPAVFANDLGLFVAAVIALGLAPYARFTPLLAEGKQRALVAYSVLMSEYVRRFDRRWLGGSDPEREDGMLGHPDFSGLADLGSSFKVVDDMRRFIPSRLDLQGLLAVALAPFLVIAVAYRHSMADVVRQLFSRFLAG
jgi:hypothetical protein